jgi:hemerythrin-like domain-containing protein
VTLADNEEPTSPVGNVVRLVCALLPLTFRVRDERPYDPGEASTPTGDPMDAIALLKDDHDKVKALLTELESTTERGVKTRAELFSTIKGELTVHEIIEEEIFYPALKDHPKAKDIVLEGYEEHHVVDLLMRELEDLDVTDETWGAKALVMKENIEHHIEEEEGDMFKQARSVFDEGELADLGARMAERKVSAQQELGIPAR